MFGALKQRRDAFVDCEPGTEASSHGYVKEAAFHDVSPVIVNEAVQATYQIIRQVWKCVHGGEGPRWLSEPTASAKLGLMLVPSTPASSPVGT